VNSLDAIIAMLILLTSLALLLGSLAEQNKYLEQGNEIIHAKMNVFECMSIIDGIYSNSVDTYEKELDCFVDEGKIKAKYNTVQKVVSVIPKIQKEHFLEVGTVDHYK
jgi:hypothetical protein